MISVFNEFRSSWIIKVNPKTNASLLSKKRRIGKDPVDDRAIYIQAEIEDSLNTTENSETILGLADMRDPVRLISDKLTVVFNRKTYVPRIEKVTSKTHPGKDILLLSLNLRDAKIVDIIANDVMLLEASELPGFFSGILVFNKPTSEITIVSYDENKRMMVSHLFSIDKGRFIKTKDIKRDVEHVIERPFMVRKYRPSKVTEAILVHDDNLEELKTMDFYKKKPENYNLFIFNDESMSSVVENAQLAGYLAISMFTPTSPDRSEFYAEKTKEYKVNFRVFYVFNQIEKITKVKVR
jgi:hypothetical protein